MLVNHRSRFEPRKSKNRLSVLAWLIVASCQAWLTTCDAYSYYAGGPWTATASGMPTTVTWGFADDGTLIPATGVSDLINVFDVLYGVTSPSGNLTQRPWFSFFQESFSRWSQLSGIDFVYEGSDDGASLQTSPGILGVRADIRIAGKFMDGPSGALAAAWMPNTGDIVLDTGDLAHFSLALTDSVRPRNTLMHEIGHTLGLMHVASSNAALLMEPMMATSFQGPQLDDIRGIQSLYGDANEKSFGGLGNDTPTRATSLGLLAIGSSLSVGSDAGGDQVVLPTETDFVSITNGADLDYYSFTIPNPGLLNVNLTPWGGTFDHGLPGGPQSPFDATSQNDLSLAILGPNGTTVLASANSSGAGGNEVLTGLEIVTAGQYFVRVLGSSNAVQLYELEIALTQIGGTIAGDFNSDGAVDGNDFLVWQRSYGTSGAGLAADGNGDGTVNALDLAIWKAHFGQAGVSLAVAIPEPRFEVLLSFLLATAIGSRRQSR
jgi:serralysin